MICVDVEKMRLLSSFLSLSLSLLACVGSTSTKDTAVDPDTDTVDPAPDYPEGCFVVDGADGYYYLNDALISLAKAPLLQQRYVYLINPITKKPSLLINHSP